MKKYNDKERAEFAREWLINNASEPFSREKLKRFIKKCGITQTKLVEIWGLSKYRQSACRYFLNDEVFSNISIDKLEKIAKYIGVDTWEMLYFEKEV